MNESDVLNNFLAYYLFLDTEKTSDTVRFYIFLVFLIIWILFGFAGFIDFIKRYSVRSFIIYIFIFILFVVSGVVGYFFYRIIRSPYTIEEKNILDLEKKFFFGVAGKISICLNCNHMLLEGQKYCTNCGYQNRINCKNCGYVIDYTHKYCPDCGTNVDLETSEIYKKIENNHVHKESSFAKNLSVYLRDFARKLIDFFNNFDIDKYKNIYDLKKNVVISPSNVSPDKTVNKKINITQDEIKLNIAGDNIANPNSQKRVKKNNNKTRRKNKNKRRK